MTIERDADDVARCFALERLLYEGGHDQPFAGEITGLISAGAFVAFGAARRRRGRRRAPPFEGMLPVRPLRPPGRVGRRARGDGRGRGWRRPAAPAGARAQPRSPARRGRRGGRAAARRAARRRREWWELNEQGTILRGERTGATLRLGDPIEVRVARVDAIRGRVDLTPAG